MAHKTFISYKYSESKDLRDKIIEVMGDDVTYYKGETSYSPDLGDMTTERIKTILKDMIYSTSVMIIIISPQMNKSTWMNWEISYALMKKSRGETNSAPNKIIGIIQEVDCSYEWFQSKVVADDGCTILTNDTSLCFKNIHKNRFNNKKLHYVCEQCRSYDIWDSSYITFVKEEEFLANYDECINKTYEKDSNQYNLYKIYDNI